MINWMYYPQTLPADKYSQDIINIFNEVSDQIDSSTNTHHSNIVLSKLSCGLQNIGFQVETGKKAEDKIHVPVLYGINGQVKLSFDADAYKKSANYVIEVEAGRAVVNYQFLKDFFEACSMVDVEYLCIAVRNLYNKNNDFNKVCNFFDVLYSSNRIQIPLKGLLIIGY